MNPEISISVERADGWASVVLDRPRRRNAFTGPMLDQLADAVDALSADTSVAAIVLRGEGSAFCSGVDLTELQAQPPQPWVPNFGVSLRRAHIALYNCACPIVVALERFAINGGSALALSGDLIVAGQTAFLQIGEIHQGARMPMNAAWLRVKGHEHLMARLALIGDRVPGPELLRLGVVHEVVDDDQVRARAEALATHFSACPPQSARRIKAEIRAHSTIDPQTWFTPAASNSLMSAQQMRR